MSWINYLYIPFPRPQKTKKNILLVVLVGLSSSFFILLYKPFGIENVTGNWLVDLVIFSLGVLFILSVLFLEFFIPSIFPNLFKNWTLGKALVWYPLLIVLVGGIQFLYKSWLGGWHDFNISEFLMVLARILGIGLTVAFFVLGIWQFLNRERLSLLTSKQKYQILSADGKTYTVNLHDILYIASDDNYVDVHLDIEGVRKKIVLRSSLKNIESQLSNPISPIHRCHRQYLINVEHFQIASEANRKMTICMEDYEDLIPVSGKYILSISQYLKIHH